METLLESLRFVQGSVAKKDIVAALSHFKISGGLIQGYNGKISLCCPINTKIEALPKARRFSDAIKACKSDDMSLKITPAGKLSVKSGKFRAYVDCTTDQFPEVVPRGELLDSPGDILEALKQLLPFIAQDASRVWSNGVLLKDYSAFATNNIVLLEYWLGFRIPFPINIPKEAVVELVRIGLPIKQIQIDTNSITFHFGENKWLNCILLDLNWPNVSAVLEAECSPVDIDQQFFDALEELLPFTDELERIFLQPDRLTTSTELNDGASIEIENYAEVGCFNAKQLLSLRRIVQKADFKRYPRPVPFFGGNLRGAIVGIRM